VAHRIEIGLKNEMRDPLGEKIKKRIQSDLGLSVDSVKTISVFTLDMDLSKDALEKVAIGPFLDPIIQEYRIDGSLAHDFDWLVEVGFKPGVTDNVGKTAKEAIEWRLGKKLKEEERVQSMRRFGITSLWVEIPIASRDWITFVGLTRSNLQRPPMESTNWPNWSVIAKPSTIIAGPSGFR
jgi:phosphoribosylformylglycinamidine (FGAM) synthase PurS component